MAGTIEGFHQLQLLVGVHAGENSNACNIGRCRAVSERRPGDYPGGVSGGHADRPGDGGRGVRDLRRLLYLGEWIESHALHIYFLHAPDFLGYPSGIELARADPDTVRRGLQLKKVGNRLMEVIGGREIHPVNPRVGGFWRAPTGLEIQRLAPEVEWALTAAEETCEWVAGFDFPELSVDYEFVALSDPDEYAVIGGRVVSNRGIDISVERWPETFLEEHVEWSNALQARVRGRGSYHVGPLARYNLNHSQLHPRARAAAEGAGLSEMVTNPFRSIVVRAVEVVHAAATVIDLVERYTPPDPPYAEAAPRAAVGHGASEAPRGLLYHRYQIDEHGLIGDAVIVPPTSQNQLRIEEDLRTLLPGLLDQDDSQITHRLEQAIRNYDPCISCATHFLDMRLERQ